MSLGPPVPQQGSCTCLLSAGGGDRWSCRSEVTVGPGGDRNERVRVFKVQKRMTLTNSKENVPSDDRTPSCYQLLPAPTAPPPVSPGFSPSCDVSSR